MSTCLARREKPQRKHNRRTCSAHRSFTASRPCQPQAQHLPTTLQEHKAKTTGSYLSQPQPQERPLQGQSRSLSPPLSLEREHEAWVCPAGACVSSKTRSLDRTQQRSSPVSEPTFKSPPTIRGPIAALTQHLLGNTLNDSQGTKRVVTKPTTCLLPPLIDPSTGPRDAHNEPPDDATLRCQGVSLQVSWSDPHLSTGASAAVLQRAAPFLGEGSLGVPSPPRTKKNPPASLFSGRVVTGFPHNKRFTMLWKPFKTEK